MFIIFAGAIQHFSGNVALAQLFGNVVPALLAEMSCPRFWQNR